jgi:hypothetical protein
MRKSSVALLLAALAVAAAACGSDQPETSAGQSGRPPTPETTEATTTTTEVTVDTLPESVVDIPDVSDLGLTWDEEPTIDELTGDIAMANFNQFLFDKAPSLMVPEGTLESQSSEDLTAAVAAAEAEAPLKTAAVFLGLAPDEPDVQMLRASSGGPEGMRVIVIRTTESDPSVRAVRWEFAIQVQARADFAPVTSTTVAPSTSAPEGGATTTTEVTGPPDEIPVVFSAMLERQCQPGKGHQDFTAESCE